MNDNIFLNYETDNYDINKIRNILDSFYVSDKHAIEFCDNIKEFIRINKIDIDLINEEVVFQYWINLLNIYLHKQNNTDESDDKMHKYVICITRLQEFLICLCTIENEEIKDIFFDKQHKHQLYYYFHIKNNISQENKEKYFDIQKEETKNRNTIILKFYENEKINSKIYYSSITIQPFKDKKAILNKYFKLTDTTIAEIFNLSSSNNDNISGKNGYKRFVPRIPFEVYENTELSKITTNIEDEEISEESKKENSLKINKAQSIIFSKEQSNLVNDEFYNIASKNDLSSKYKRFQISKAISNSITKRNVDLQSNYKIPEFETFKETFIKIKSDDLYFKIIELSLFTAIEIKKLILILLNLDTQISYKSNKTLLEININRKIFASVIVNEEFSENTNNKICQIHLPYNLTILWVNACSELKQEFYNKYTNESWIKEIKEKNIDRIKKEIEKKKKDGVENSEDKVPNIDIEAFCNFVNNYKKEHHKSDFQNFIHSFKNKHSKEEIKHIEDLKILDYFVNEFHENINSYLNEKLKPKKKKDKTKPINDKKRIVLPIKSINRLFLHYYKKFNDCSELNLLYAQSISKNDEARLCYNAAKDRLINYENAIDEFYCRIYDKQPDNLVKELSSTFWVGSPYYIKPGSFKKFIFEISKINSTNEIEILNLNMIFIRYALSILLGTRDFKNSSNLTEYSKELKILLIQEKAKNIYSSKRIIPLCNLALKLINTFNQIKNEYNLLSNYPILLDNQRKEIELSKKNMKIFLKSFGKTIYQNSSNYIYNFIDYTNLNFGRHIITSYLSSSSLQSNYLDAFLNHFKMGKEDQGIFSNFHNLDYIEKIVNKLDEISNLYFPKYIKIGSYEYR